MTNTSEQDSSNVQTDTKKKLHWLEIGYFSSQIILAVIGIWALCIYHGQLKAMQGQLTQMQGSSQQMWSAISNVNWMARSMDWSQKTAQQGVQTSEQQSDRSLTATQQQMRLDERAWVGTVHSSIVLDPSKLLETGTNVIVLGKSPAIDVKSNMGMTWFPPGHVLQRSEMIFTNTPTNNGTVFPGTEFHIAKTAHSTDISKEQLLIKEILNKRLAVYFFGEITYRDIFEGQHWTHFCYIFTDTNPANAQPCTTYNDSDAQPDPQQPKE